MLAESAAARQTKGCRGPGRPGASSTFFTRGTTGPRYCRAGVRQWSGPQGGGAMDGVVVKVSYRGVVRYVPRAEWEGYSERQRSAYQVIKASMTPGEADAETRREAAGAAAAGPWVVYRVEARG